MQEQHQGTVKWFNNSKGFGFILLDSGEDVFVHFTVIEGDGFRTLIEGETVQFEMERGPKGYHATTVRRPSDRPI
jgi:CspA family cold shock protein